MAKLSKPDKLTIDGILQTLRIHIAPVGYEVDRIVLPAKAMKADRVWLILHNDPEDLVGKSFSDSITKQLDDLEIEYEFENADRTNLFDTLGALRTIMLKEKENAIFANVSVGSKIQAIASMMACMMFKDEVNIKPYYAVPNRYATIPKEQETFGLKKVITLPEYKIETPQYNLIKCLEIINQRKGNMITKKELKDQALELGIIHVEKSTNEDQSAYMALSKNLIYPLESKWKFIKVEKVGRRHNVSLTEEGLNVLKFLHTEHD
jgi:hypothetical protein